MFKEFNKKEYAGQTGNVPIEKHETAAWANISRIKPVSKVTIPGEFHVERAKEYVDENQK